MTDVATLVQRVRGVLREEDRNDTWRGHPNPMAGHCYVASEVLKHLLGDPAWKAASLSHEGVIHWYLQHDNGAVLDATADQFETPPDYSQGRRRGFLTRQPSRRAQEVLSRL